MIFGWTGRVWWPFHDTAARTRSGAIALFCKPSGYEPVATRAEYRNRRRAGLVKAVQLLAITPEPGGKR